MATPSLTSAGLWSERYTCTSNKTLTLKIGIPTRIDLGEGVRVNLTGKNQVFEGSSVYFDQTFVSTYASVVIRTS